MTRYSCYGNVCIVWVCVYNKQVQQRLSTGQKLNDFVCLSWILESLHGGFGIRSEKGVAPPPPPSFLVQLGKQSRGVVCYLAVTTTLSVCITELKWTSKVSAEKRFYPDSAFLVQNCQHLVFNCKDSWHIVCHNSQTEHRHEAKTLCKKLCHKLAILSWKIKYLKSTSGASDTNMRA